MISRDGQREVREGRYGCPQGRGICIVASITHGIDWAAYIGADQGRREADCITWTDHFGAKLTETDARHYFPDITMPYRH